MLPPAPLPPVPTFLTSLLGRDRDLAEVTTLVGAARLVTLVGAGGTGKTRLAAAAAEVLGASVAGRVAWVELAPLCDESLVAVHVAALLGVREKAARGPVAALVEAVGDQPILLVLDNCEHLLEACEELATELLRSCPALRILATSRQPLGVAGEKGWPVPPLALPAPGDEDAATDYSAVQLFVQRAADAVHGFVLTEENRAAVVRICRRLDGLPLAIELAAARVTVLPPEQLANRLDDAFAVLSLSGRGTRTTLPRHRTLRALIDWSYGLLTDTERVLLTRLSVFSGGFTLEAAEAVAGFGAVAGGDVLELLAALVDQSLVTMQEQAGEARYSLLETVRQYAAGRLRDSSDPAHAVEGERPADLLACRHAEHYLGLAEVAAVALHGPAQLEWLARLAVEHDNLRAALRRRIDAGAAEPALRLCIALRHFWHSQGHLVEGARWTDDALRLEAVPALSALRARALVGSCLLARRLGSHDVFRARAVEAEALARAAHEAVALAEALTVRGVHLRDVGDLPAARARLEEAIALWRTTADAFSLGVALCVRSAIANEEDDLPLARALRLEAADLARRHGDREGLATALIGLGELARIEQDVEGARAYYARSRTLYEELGDRWCVAAIFHNLGWLAAEEGAQDEARRAFVAALEHFDSEWALIVAPCLAGLARLLAVAGDPELAAEALGCAMTSIERASLRPARADARSYELARAVVLGALETDAFERAWARGALGVPTDYVGRVLARLDERATATRSDDGAASVRAAPLRVAALGTLEIAVDGALLDLEQFGSRRVRELLLFLLCHPAGCTREQVGLVFWPDGSAAEVKNRFHVSLHRLRRALGHPDWIRVTDGRYGVAPELPVDFDVTRFEAAVTEALGAVRAGKAAPERLGAALALYRGDFLFEENAGDWHLATRDRLRRLCVEGHLALGELLLARGSGADAAAVFATLLAHDPLEERGHRGLMSSFARTGQRAEAMRQYERLVRVLREELEAEPDEETTALHERIRRGGAD